MNNNIKCIMYNVYCSGNNFNDCVKYVIISTFEFTRIL